MSNMVTHRCYNLSISVYPLSQTSDMDTDLVRSSCQNDINSDESPLF